ncbi:MAG: hypothetical protein HY222_06250 [Thaumarchaeota archaeon]|nr:hypothetical protein [Nitrososphaerota archaeon]MBI3641978.1 hypothetical protein [Nitrososphaerota archaeon]
MPDEYTKIISQPEARHRYWHINAADRSFFPESSELFKVEFDGKIFQLKVNHKNDVMTGQLYERYKFKGGDRIILKKKKNGTFLLDAPDTELYPEI